MEIFDKNLKYIKNNFVELGEALEEYLEKNVELSENVYVEEDFVAVVKDDRPWYFTSRYNQEEGARIWASQFEPEKDWIYVMAGLGNGVYLNALLDRLPDSSCVIVYEPDVNIFIKALYKIDLEKLFRGRAVIVCEGINKGHLYEYFAGNFTYENRIRVSYCIHPGYDKVYPDKTEWLRSVCENELSVISFSRNTELKFSLEFFDNLMNNLWEYEKHSTLVELKQALELVDKDEVPAVIVAAGPSLNKNVTELKNFKNKAFVIACDSALNPLFKNDIMPDISITVDSHKPLSLFAHPNVKKLPFVLCLQSVTWFRDYHEGKKFYFADNSLGVKYITNYGKSTVALETSGSVANNAFSLAQYLGFKKIILIGQDLAYADGIYYASGVHEDSKVSAMDESKKNKYYEVEGYYGGKVYTEDNLNLYRTWFEKQIIRYKDLRVMNATQGGAMIHGAENIDLKDALERECGREYDFSTLINSAPDTFTEEQLEVIHDDFLKFKDTLDDISKDIKEGITKYYRLAELMRKGKTGTAEFKRLFERISEIQDRVQEEPLMDIAALHNRFTEYAVLDEKMDSENEIENGTKAIRLGIKMLESYQYGIDKVIEALPILNEQLERHSER